MKKSLTTIIVLALAPIIQAQQTCSQFTNGVCSQYSIAIQNPSFESPVALPEIFNCQTQLFGGYQPGTMRVGRVVPGWQRSFDAETAYPLGVAAWSCFPTQSFRVGNPLNDSAYLPPDGKNVAFIGYGHATHLAIWQDLGVLLQGGTYNLTFYTANWDYSYPGKLRASISVGQHELCASDTWALGAWTEVTLPCNVPGYLTYNGFGWTDFGNGNVSIRFQHSDGWIVMLDEVSMTLTAPAFVSDRH